MRFPLFASALAVSLLAVSRLSAQQPTAAAPVPPPAQPVFSADSTAVMQVVKNIFNGMRTRDTALMRAQFHSSATMRSASYNRTGVAVIEEDGPSEWITGVAGAPANLLLDERIGPPAVHVDGNLATVWVYYEFYAGENFSHCGADVFTFGRTTEGWKIVFVADSRRRTGCAKNLAKGS